MKTIRRLNINIAIKILLLLGFASFFLYIIATGKVKLYVHPRIIPYMIFASVVMVVIAILLSRDLFKPAKEKVSSWSLLFYIVPLIMAFVLPAMPFKPGTGAIDNVQLNSLRASKQTVSSAKRSSEKFNKNNTSSNNDKRIHLQNGILVMTDNNFNNCLNEISNDIDKYEGVKIEVVGFVFKDNDKFSDNEFVPARLMMVCCAADMVPVGFLCRYDKASDLAADTWVKVTGTIGKTQFEGETIPYIQAENVEKANKPVKEYVYPY